MSISVRSRITVLHLDTERGWRGGERQALWLAQALDRARYRSVIGARSAEPLALRAAVAGLEVLPLHPVTEVDLVAAWRLRAALRRERVDIVHAHTAHAVSLAALAITATRAHLVATRRVDFPLRGNAGSRWKYRRADALIAISAAVADVMAASGIPRTRTTIIPSGIDLTRRIEAVSADMLALLGVPAGAPLVVQVAQLVPHKDPLTFVDAIAAAREHVPDLHALLVGDGELREAVVAAVRDRGLTDVVHLTGYRTDADNLLAAADVATLSSREEGLGTVVLDALALGKPVAATRAGGIPEIVTAGSGRLVATGDGRALGQAIADLVRAVRESPQRRAAIATAARQRAAAFDIAITAAKTAEVYERVMATAPSTIHRG